MNFEFSADQDALREQVRKFLVKESPLGLSRQLMDGEAAGAQRRDALWRGLGGLGVTALMLPEHGGGIGLGAMELCVVAEEIGRQLSPVPLASTLYLGAQALLLGASAAQQQRWLPGVAAGAAGCLAAPLDGQIDAGALPRFDGARLSGRVELVADGAAAQWAVVLAADAQQRPLLVWVGLGQDGIGRRALATLDGAKPCAALRFEAVAAEPLAAVDDAPALLQRVRHRAAVLLAFEQLGAADAALDMAVAYARDRRAFGRAIGSYQGIKHKLADLYTEIQMARAHCYYGAWALAADVAAPAPELPAAAAAARLSASRAFSLMAQEGLHVHGGIGYTWELDCHLFLRRARHQAVLLGHETQWSEQLAAELVRWLEQPLPASERAADEGAMNFDDTPDEAAFRAECRAWLVANAVLKQRPDDFFEPQLSPPERMQRARDWQARKAAAGFAAITWPKALGGRGGTPMQELIWRQEEGRYNVPTGFFNVSLGMVLPSVMAHAAKEVLAAHVAPALTGRHLWCQLLSEPGAGSDLGMVRTRAERCGDGRDGWMLNGQKVWTSLAQFADYGLVLARTDPQQPKFDGLTTFFIDMKSPGVTVRPIRQASGEAEFNEVFLDAVFVPDSQRVGAVNAGWKTTLTGLMSERLAIGGVMPAQLWQLVAELLRDARFLGRSALDDGRMRERLADLYLNAQALWLLQCRALTALSKGRMPGPEMSGAKNVAASTLQRIGAFAIDLQGPRGVLAASELGERFALIERLWFGAAGMRIAGGTDEVIRNSIGERVLGLPGEPRSDKALPFSQLVG